MTWTTLPTGAEVYRRRGATVVGTDRYGNDILEAVVTLLPQRAAFDPGGSVEPVEVGRAAVVTTPKAYFVEDVDLVAGDDVEIDGRWYTVEGRPLVYGSPFGSDVGGTVVELREVAG